MSGEYLPSYPRAEDYEIVVIDNGSTDETVTYMKTQTDVILHENTENLGFDKGCNQGIEYASGDSLADLVDEIIIVDTGSTDQTLKIANQYTPHVFSFAGAAGNPIAYQYAFDVATNDYILWLQAGDILNHKEKREFSGLKLSVDTEVNIITMTVDGATEQSFRYLIRKGGGFMPLDQIEQNLQMGSMLDSGIQIKHMA